MFKLREISSMIVISLILAFATTLIESLEIFLYTLLSIFIILMINILAKKITAEYLESEIEAKIWQIERWGLSGIILFEGTTHPSKKFKHPFFIGAILPIVSKIILMPVANFVWMASMTFDAKIKVYKSAKRHNAMYDFSEITDYQIGVIASVGILATLVFAVIGNLIYLPPEMNFVKLSVFYAFFNSLPLSSLDGNKVFFGNKTMWVSLFALVLASTGYVIFLI